MEVKLSYVIDLPKTMINMSSHSLAWKNAVVAFTDNDIWFPSISGWNMIPYRSIETVDRELSPSVINNVRVDTGYAAEIAIDYKKNPIFGSSQINYSMIFAGNPEDIAHIKDHLIERIGFRANTDFEGLKEEETRLLSLLRLGPKDINKHISLVSTDREVLERAFDTLKIRKLVDENAHITQQGHYYLENLKEEDPFDNTLPLPSFSSPSEGNDIFTPKNNIVKFTKKYEYSSVSGSVFLEDIWYFVISPEIRDITINKVNIFDMELHLQNLSGATILIESDDNRVLLALSRIFNMKENLHIRVLSSLYIGIGKEKDIANLLYIEPSELEMSIKELVDSKVINAENNLTEKGIETVKQILKIKNNPTRNKLFSDN